jgi:uncharacterized repeat protein (TIGR01451 family)
MYATAARRTWRGFSHLTHWWIDGPGNTVTNPRLDPKLEMISVGAPNEDPCATAEFGPVKVRVTIPLAGSGVSPDDVYARIIYAGWVASAPAGAPVPVRHFRVRLDSMHLIDDHDDDPLGFDNKCECTFFWMNVDRAPNAWIRLSDFAEGNMNNFGSGETMKFGQNAIFDFFVQDGQSFTIRADGFDGGVGERGIDPGQDCLDNHFGHHDLKDHVDILGGAGFPDICYEEIARNGPGGPNDDPFETLQASFGPANGYGVGQQTLRSGPTCIARVRDRFDPSAFPVDVSVPCDPAKQRTAVEKLKDRGLVILEVFEKQRDYELVVIIEEIHVATADLVISQVASGNTVAAGEEVTFRVSVRNLGPDNATGVSVSEALPRGARVVRVTPSQGSCTPIPTRGSVAFICDLGGLVVGSGASIEIVVRPTTAGPLTSTATVSGKETDPDTNNTVTTSITVNSVADLFIASIVDSPDPVMFGSRVTYRIAITNNGPSRATQLFLTDNFQGTFNSASADCTWTPANFLVTCSLDDLEGGRTAVVQIVFIADQAAGPLLNRATVGVRSDVFDPDLANNQRTENTTVIFTAR